MGYEIKMIVGKSCHASDEIERDMTKPYEDGSGFEYKKDENGDYVKTGRKEIYFMRMAEVDLCKLGYQDDSLNRLISESFAKGKADTGTVHYFYFGGNDEVKEDLYGEKMHPVPVADVLSAMEEAHPVGDYRRTDWAIALLRSLVNDPEGLEVLFFGH